MGRRDSLEKRQARGREEGGREGQLGREEEEGERQLGREAGRETARQTVMEGGEIVMKGGRRGDREADSYGGRRDR